jgi:hypothetical protein
MASFRLNVARIRGLPPVKDIVSALKQFGMPAKGEFGVISYAGTADSVTAEIIHRSRELVGRLDPTGQKVIPTPVERIIAYPFQVSPAKERLEIHAGAANGIEKIGTFMASHLSLTVTTELVELDVVRAVGKLSSRVERFRLHSVRLEGYAYNSYMVGTYSPRFLDSEHGLEFLAEHDEGVLSACVRFVGPNGRVSLIITRNACFTYSCEEADQDFAKTVLRRLA